MWRIFSHARLLVLGVSVSLSPSILSASVTYGHVLSPTNLPGGSKRNTMREGKEKIVIVKKPTRNTQREDVTAITERHVVQQRPWDNSRDHPRDQLALLKERNTERNVYYIRWSVDKQVERLMLEAMKTRKQYINVFQLFQLTQWPTKRIPRSFFWKLFFSYRHALYSQFGLFIQIQDACLEMMHLR